MFRRLCLILAAIGTFCTSALAIDAEAVVRKIDIDQKTVIVFANGQNRKLAITSDTKVLDANGAELPDGLRSEKLSEGVNVTISVTVQGRNPTLNTISLGGRTSSPAKSKERGQSSVGKPSIGFKPLTEMSADDRYKGEDGGLYGSGQNEPPESLKTALTKQSSKVVPRNANGDPAVDGKIGLVSISMSNATQEYAVFKRIADADRAKSARVHVVDCAQGGQTMARWADLKSACWQETDRRLESAGVSPHQVQVAWIKLANAGPNGELSEHGKILEKDTRAVLANLMQRFPNLKIAYLGSRIYGGYADGRLNPEPYAYEGAFVVRWLIKGQQSGNTALNFDGDRGEVKSPLLAWGPYLWADGLTPRKSDGLVWKREDLVTDGTHPSDSGRLKVAEMLLDFFKTDAHASQWFVAKE